MVTDERRGFPKPGGVWAGRADDDGNVLVIELWLMSGMLQEAAMATTAMAVADSTRTAADVWDGRDRGG